MKEGSQKDCILYYFNFIIFKKKQTTEITERSLLANCLWRVGQGEIDEAQGNFYGSKIMHGALMVVTEKPLQHREWNLVCLHW